MALFVACVGPVVAALIVLEKRLPFQAQRRPNRTDVRIDFTYLMTGYFIFSPLAQLLVKAIGWTAVGLFASRVSFGVWPSQLPLGVQVLLALSIAELVGYAVHRFAHETSAGWRVHATHHAATQMYWLNANRFHAIETVVKTSLQVLPLVMLGAGREVFLAYGAISAAHGFILHSNVDYRPGILSLFIGTPNLHRWHHSTIMAEANNNFGNVLTLWDHVFGSYYFPKGREFTGAVGLMDDSEFPTTYFGQMKSPFTGHAPIET